MSEHLHRTRTTEPGALVYRLAAIAAGAAAVIVLLNQHAYRGVEASMEAGLVDGLTPTATMAVPATATVISGLGTRHAVGFVITPVCSSAMLVGGFLAVTAVLLAVRRWSLWAIASALAAAIAIEVVVNLLRLSLIIWATRAWNHGGYEASHVYLGTFVTLFGLIVAILAYLRILGGRHAARHGNPPPPAVA